MRCLIYFVLFQEFAEKLFFNREFNIKCKTCRKICILNNNFLIVNKGETKKL